MATIKVYDSNHQVKSESKEASLETIKASEVIGKAAPSPSKASNHAKKPSMDTPVRLKD